MTERISRDEMFMSIAFIVAKRGTCNRAYVGAVLTSQNRIISIGYNGAPSGKPHCDEAGHNLINGHCTNAVHAEDNCCYFGWQILQPWYPKEDMSVNIHLHDFNKDLVLYVTHEPCWNCLRKIVANLDQLQITKIVYQNDYGVDKTKIDFCKEWGVELVQYVK